jgi:hypothetical protein
MFSRKVAAVAAFSLLLATSPSMAQTADPAAPPPVTAPAAKPAGDRNDFTQSGLLLMLTAIVGAILLAVLATQLGGDEPASP